MNTGFFCCSDFHGYYWKTTICNLLVTRSFSTQPKIPMTHVKGHIWANQPHDSLCWPSPGRWYQPLQVDSFLTSFQRKYTLTTHICIDEYLGLWRGKLKFRMYILSKRERYGIKVYKLRESSTGYLCNYIVYRSTDTSYPGPGHNFPKGFDDCSNPSKRFCYLWWRICTTKVTQRF